MTTMCADDVTNARLIIAPATGKYNLQHEILTFILFLFLYFLGHLEYLRCRPSLICVTKKPM